MSRSFAWLAGGAAVLIAVLGAFLLGRSTDGGANTDRPGSPEPQREPICSRSAAEKATIASEFDEEVRGYASVNASLAGYPQTNIPFFTSTATDYQVGLLRCRDVTGDGRDDMIVGLGAGAAGRISQWAIFAPDSTGKWSLAFTRIGSLIDSLKVVGRSIVVRTPTFGAHDPLCCPSGHKSVRIFFRRGEFVADTSLVARAHREVDIADGRVTRLGQLDPSRDSPVQALADLGSPTAVGSSLNSSCPYEWSDLGVSITFANFGGADPCGRDGRIASFELEGSPAEQAGWRVADGAAVGMDVKTLRRLYPGGREDGRELVLVETPSAIGADGTLAVMTAFLAGGKALAYRFYVGAAGE